MGRMLIGLVAAAVVAGAGLAAPAGAATLFRSFFVASLDGFAEVPSLATPGRGSFIAVAARSGDQLDYALRLGVLEGEQVIFAHIHLGRTATNGGVMAFLCSNVPVPVSTPACPSGAGGIVTGALTAADVIGPAEQGVAPGEFDELLRALRAGAGYVNVHTDAFPTGEVRGQIR